MYLEKGREEELLCYMRQGCPYAESTIHEYLYTCIEHAIYNNCTISLSDADREDLKQQLMIYCLEAIDSYRNDETCSFRTFISVVIRRRLNKLIKELTLYNTYNVTNLTDINDEDINLEDQEEYRYYFQPYENMMVCDQMDYYMNEVDKKTTELERLIYYYYVLGYKANEISELTGMNTKMITNGIYRTRAKLKK